MAEFIANLIILIVFSSPFFALWLLVRFIKKKNKNFCLYVGNNFKNNTPIYIHEKGLYQNLLITGTIGSGKTSSAMYPFCKQLINFSVKRNVAILLRFT